MLAQHFFQIHAVNILHGIEVNSVFHAGLVYLRDIGMPPGGHCPGFIDKSGSKGDVTVVAVIDDFDSSRALKV